MKRWIQLIGLLVILGIMTSCATLGFKSGSSTSYQSAKEWRIDMKNHR